jgi:phenylpyruvate tautomerase PptA (4-oxalocrotonate tautomerase family)
MQKKIILLITSCVITFLVKAQINVNVFINGIKAGAYTVKVDDVDDEGIAYKKKIFKKTDKLTIELSGKSLAKGYFRKVQVVGDGDKDKVLETFEETQGAVGQFILTNEKIFNRLSKGNAIKLYLLMTPANTKSKMPSKKIFIGTIAREK